MDELKRWIETNLQCPRGLIGKRCNRRWFENNKYIEYWNRIHKCTECLDSTNPTFPQRVWHIVNDYPTVKCGNPECSNLPTFWSFNRGYLRACSPLCSQHNPETIRKIKETNLQRYGAEYGLQNAGVKKKRSITLMNKYGVENISQAPGISERKKKTCLKNYGTEWFLARTDLIKKCINDKYGVDNVQLFPDIRNQTIHTRRLNFYNSLFTTNRLNGVVIPLFSKNDYVSGGLLKKYLFECIKCKTHFEDCLEDGDIPRCPTCYKCSSVFEKEITEYVKSVLAPTEIVMENVRTILNNTYELDIYVPSKNIAIECNGLFWHGEVGGNKGKWYHLNKTMRCEDKGIRLIHIFEDEWTLSPDIVKNRLSHILNASNVPAIYARDCSIKEITTGEKDIFLTQNHIQGTDTSKIKLGLYDTNNELVAVMTFGLRRIFMNCKSDGGEYELMRFATKKPVVGGASKLLAHFIANYSPKKIISYADRRWTYSKNNLYERIGFKKVSDGTPNYWYFGQKRNYKRHHRFGFAKHTLAKKLATFDPAISEWKNMQNNGWDRIWDCGSLKYEMAL